MKPVAYVSRKLKGAEINYTVTEKELVAIVYCVEKLHHYLHGASVTFITDHKALTWLFGLKDPTGRLARWILRLQPYDFIVNYRKGSEMQGADCLSRDTREEEAIEAIEVSHSLPTVDEFIQHQKAQKEVELQSAVEKTEVNEYGLIYKLVDERELVWVPSTLVERVLGYYHGPAFVGHFGRERMTRRISRRFWWPRMKESCEAFLAKCPHCVLERLPRNRPTPKGVTVPYTPTRRFEVVGIDVTTVTPVSTTGNSKVLVMIDLFSRYVVAVPMKDEGARATARAFLENWVYRFGPPEKLLSDRGASFTGEVMMCVCDLLGTKKVFTTPYHPETNGMVERYNRTLLSEIRARVVAESERWDEHLPLACYAYNVSYHSTTKVSPYEAMYGTPVNDFDRDMQLCFVTEEEAQAELDVESSLARIHTGMISNTVAARLKVAKWYNSKIADYGLTPGRRVMVFSPDLTKAKGRKLTYPWRGPYRIEEIIRWNNVLLKSEATGELSRAHMNRLAPIGAHVMESRLNPAVTGVFPDTRTLLDSVLDVRRDDGIVSFQVLFQGEEEPRWVDEADLPPVLLNLYYDKLQNAHNLLEGDAVGKRQVLQDSLRWAADPGDGARAVVAKRKRV